MNLYRSHTGLDCDWGYGADHGGNARRDPPPLLDALDFCSRASGFDPYETVAAVRFSAAQKASNLARTIDCGPMMTVNGVDGGAIAVQ